MPAHDPETWRHLGESGVLQCTVGGSERMLETEMINRCRGAYLFPGGIADGMA